MQLGEPVDGGLEQLRPRVVGVIPARVVRGVAQAEVGPEVDDGLAGVQELVDAGGRGPVGKGEEDGLGVLGDGVVDPEALGGEVGVDPGQRVALPLPPDEADDGGVGVAGEEPHELRADVPGRPDDRHLDRIAVERAQTVRGRGAGRGRGVERTVRRDRRARRVRAHGRARPLTGGRLEGSENGRHVISS